MYLLHLSDSLINYLTTLHKAKAMVFISKNMKHWNFLLSWSKTQYFRTKDLTCYLDKCSKQMPIEGSHYFIIMFVIQPIETLKDIWISKYLSNCIIFTFTFRCQLLCNVPLLKYYCRIRNMTHSRRLWLRLLGPSHHDPQEHWIHIFRGLLSVLCPWHIQLYWWYIIKLNPIKFY